MKNMFRSLLTALSLGVLATSSVRADDVTDSIDEALKAYKDKDYAMAAQGLETATQLIKQKRGEALTKFFPKAPSGWTATDATSEAAANAFFGGGITAERDYTKGDANVSVKFLSDSPMMQGVMMMMSNPMFAGADGGKLERIKGQKAVVKYDAGNKSGSINIAIAGTLLIQIEGSDCTAADMRAIADAIDYAALTAAL